ncbi:hypothetical protein [Paraburkholderia strydomiana]|uniref:Uncharacterized protein n=1 Tax=Paraburkholderia strydomiana TaxID=1245417 RepID=A0ABW9BVK4_9BURK
MTPDECLARFMAAVRAARSGDNRPGNELIREVRQRHGDEAAEIQRRELRNYVDSEKNA